MALESGPWRGSRKIKRKRFSEEQIISILREHEAGSADGRCRRHGMSDASLYAWKAKFGGMDVTAAQKLVF